MSEQRKILKSWKAIATYLGVGVRTAQRWTTVRGLPVRRPNGSRGAAVLSFSDDIDRWLRAPNGQTDEPSGAMDVTDLLTSRPSRPRQLEPEIDALLELGCLIARQTNRTDVLRRIATVALMQCKAESSGFSILETNDDGQEIFRWHATCGRMGEFEGGWTPANFSPCGLCLERNAAQLLHYPEQFYAYLNAIAPIAELLLIPIHDGNDWFGTIWVISHTGRRKFDAEDARLLRDLGELAGTLFSKAAARAPRLPTPKTAAARHSPARRPSRARARRRA